MYPKQQIHTANPAFLVRIVSPLLFMNRGISNIIGSQKIP